MFGLTFEKLLLVAVIAGVVIGPHRLPHYARRLAEIVRSLRALIDTTRTRVEAETGGTLASDDWTSLDLRRYDPRRIVRDALDTPSAPDGQDAALMEQARRIRPGQRFIVTGSAAHPRRIAIASLPPDDPRRIAAEAVPAIPTGTATHSVDRGVSLLTEPARTTTDAATTATPA